MTIQNVFKNLVLLTVASLLLVQMACTKKREPTFPDGAGLDLLAISEYDLRKEELETKDPKSNVYFTSSEFSTEKDSAKIKLVNYETAAPFFPKDIELAGLEKTKYKLIYKVTTQSLIIYRNGPENSIAQEEKIVAELEEDKTLSVPLVSYPITGFFKVLVAKDDNGDKTSRLREEATQSKSEATHFRISRVPDIKVFDERRDHVIKANYFDGVWYTSTVVSKAAEESSTILGQQVSYDSEWKSADKIQFVRTQDYIMGLNANYDKRIKISDDMDKLNNLATVMKIPAKYLDADSISKSDSAKYTKDKSKLKNWKEREWAMVDFAKTTSDVFTALTPADAKTSGSSEPILTNFRMSDDFFMFSLQFKGLKLTASFRKESSIRKLSKTEYKPRVYFYNDFRYFGFFATSKTSLQTVEKHRLENYELNQFINRFHPEDYKTKEGTERKRIRFFLTEETTTEPHLIDTIRNALKAWDFAFKQAGMSDVDVYLDETQRVALGDIRYNSVNLVRTLTSTSLFGYGPSIADPDSGQIVSATTNVHITSIRDSIVGSLREYIRHMHGDLAPNYPLGIKNGTSVGLNSPDVQAMAQSNGAPTTTALSSGAPVVTKGKSGAPQFSFGHAQCDFALTSGNLIRDIEKNPDCAPLREFVRSTKKSSSSKCTKDSSDVACKELEVLTKCAEALLPEKMSATILHELGHNFGLRHNFAASTDSDNYTHVFDPKQLLTIKDYSCPSAQKTSSGILARSSSVMEYTSLNEDRLTFVGPYDIEAIRYGYVGKIKDSSCADHTLEVTSSIDKNLESLKVTKLPMKFCTDVHDSFKMDPLCQKHDSGATPLEVVQALKEKYNATFALLNFKYDKARSPSPTNLMEYKNEYIFSRMKVIYEQWRVYVSEFVGQQKATLETFDSKSYEDELQKMKADPKYGKYYEQYYEASREISKFLLQVMFIPDRYCLIKKADGSYDILELELLIKRVEAKEGVREISCNSRYISIEIAKQGKFERQVGFYNENQKAQGDMHSSMIDLLNMAAVKAQVWDITSSRDAFASYWDIIGTKLDKLLAKDVLTKRESLGFILKQRELSVSMLDEPDIRDAFVEKMTNRILYGVSYQDIFPETADKSSFQNFYFEKWKSEYVFLIQTWSFMKTAFAAGASSDITKLERNKKWDIATISDREKAAQFPEEQKFESKSGTFFVATDKENTITIAMLKRLKDLLKMQKEDPNKFRSKQQDYETQIAVFAFILNISL